MSWPAPQGHARQRFRPPGENPFVSVAQIGMVPAFSTSFCREAGRDGRAVAGS